MFRETLQKLLSRSNYEKQTEYVFRTKAKEGQKSGLTFWTQNLVDLVLKIIRSALKLQCFNNMFWELFRHKYVVSWGENENMWLHFSKNKIPVCCSIKQHSLCFVSFWLTYKHRQARYVSLARSRNPCHSNVQKVEQTQYQTGLVWRPKRQAPAP